MLLAARTIMWTFEHAETTSARPDRLWALYMEPMTWPKWDHEIAAVTLQGPVAVGARGRLKPVTGPQPHSPSPRSTRAWDSRP